MKTFNKSYGNLTSIPLEVFQTIELEKLFLIENELTEITINIGQLVNLEELRLNGNQITHLPPEIGQLKQLRSLYLSNNNLTTLPPEIGLLENLTALHLAGNRINELPKEIGGLSKLRELSLNGNQLHSLPSEIGKLTNLEHFSISRNSFSFLPAEAGQLSKVKRFNHNENSFPTLPPEIIDKGPLGILNYFGSLEEDKQALNEVKVLLVGEGSAGKTSLVKRLLGEEFDKYEPQTHGININNWYISSETQEIKVNIWDFGGQEIMHATHQFFLSRRSLYILVLDSRKDEKAEYWLKHIESFGGDSPIIVVVNKIDENPSFNVNERFLKKKYKGIKGIYRISCAEDTGIKALSKCLIRELAQVKMIKTTWAQSWFAVKGHLENLEGYYISYEQYKKLCLQCGVSVQSNQNTLIDFLHDIGTVIHFRDFDLEDVHVLEPQWITEAVYKIINSRELAANKGLLMLQDLSAILKANNDNEY
ncbi:MAG: COR domain-containing protein, partial [Cyanobacteria bacterium J06649_4]